LALDSAEEGTNEEKEQQQQLQYAVRKLSLALICQQIGSTPFKSPIISLCAMLSRTVHKTQQQPQQQQQEQQEKGFINRFLKRQIY